MIYLTQKRHSKNLIWSKSLVAFRGYRMLWAQWLLVRGLGLAGGIVSSWFPLWSNDVCEESIILGLVTCWAVVGLCDTSFTFISCLNFFIFFILLQWTALHDNKKGHFWARYAGIQQKIYWRPSNPYHTSTQPARLSQSLEARIANGCNLIPLSTHKGNPSMCSCPQI